MDKIKILRNGTRFFTNGKSHVGDGIYYGFKGLNMSHKAYLEWLDKEIPKNETLIDLEEDILNHKCENKNIIVKDNYGKIRIGFQCEGCKTKWEVPLPDVKACVHHHKEFREIMETTESREQFSKTLN